MGLPGEITREREESKKFQKIIQTSNKKRDKFPRMTRSSVEVKRTKMFNFSNEYVRILCFLRKMLILDPNYPHHTLDSPRLKSVSQQVSREMSSE